ncbi:MAG: hydrogenobyrinic acid a,c-diamide synthase (glutamine-hydrolyzing), partial [Syntrophobacteraceae bacterium]|nr:hydrogenobyrinic acid a,c-diamide synthase (glutamine-hydrolyzing) [Syntrophobacteraceae bacterium]
LKGSFEQSSIKADLALIEGNMGLYDGIDGGGEGSSAYLARLLKTPVILVVNTARMTRSVAALVKGYMTFEEDTAVAGVILNNVAGMRHERKLVDAVERHCNIPVLGSIPRDPGLEINERHLGLVPFRESETGAIAVERILRVVERHMDLEGLLSAARAAPRYEIKLNKEEKHHPHSARIGVMLDRAFHFYYPENLEALRREGADLVFIDALTDERLPDIDGLYMGGGFPELYLDALQRNRSLPGRIASAIEGGMPVYAECAGLMYLCENIRFDGSHCHGAGVIPSDVDFTKRPQGHGYVEAEVRYENPFYPVGAKIRGHEFHHSRLTNTKGLHCALELSRGQGIDGTMDGIVYKNMFASYTHVHALGTPEWAQSFVSLASRASGQRASFLSRQSSGEVIDGRRS